MDNETRIKDAEQYSGQYVAVKSFSDRDVVSFGPEPVKVVESAKQKGIDEPVLLFIPEKGILNIY